MCATCGCSDPAEHDGASGHEADHWHVHEDGRAHSHAPGAHADGHVHKLEHAVLAKNDRLAAQNRGWLLGRRVLALNLVSSPGAGKTTLLETTLRAKRGRVPFCVIEGDQATSRDAERIRAAGARAVQINTGTGCHLDAGMVAGVLDALDPAPRSIVAIENVGNLVCPALFDLGEAAKVLVASVTEGEDKPIKYPHMFRASALVLLNKVDLSAHVTFDVGAFAEMVREVNPRAEILHVSAKTGQGMDEWYRWLDDRLAPLGRGDAGDAARGG